MLRRVDGVRSAGEINILVGELSIYGVKMSSIPLRRA
jgi:hypothetical protein